MKLIREENAESFLARLRKRAATSVLEEEIQDVVRKIILEVRIKGDRAVKR